MQAEIVAIGTELTSGQKLDTNSQWLSLELADLGIPVRFHTTAADDLNANIEVLRIAAARSDLVIVSGGLGPTLDDLTRDVLAAVAGVELVLDPASLERIAGLFRSRGREMPERNRVQAMFPRGSEPIPNSSGTAPGIWMEWPAATAPSVGGWRDPVRRRCILVALPGVPSEMHRMFHESVKPRLAGPGRVIRRACINCYGLGESHMEQLLGELTARGGDPDIGITVHEATISLRIIAEGNSEAECRAKIEAARDEIDRRLGHYVVGQDEVELEHAVLGLLRDRGLTLATVECGTGGGLAQRLASVNGDAGTYRGGLVIPDGVSAGDVLGDHSLQAAPAAAHAERLAVLCRTRFGSDLALAVSQSLPDESVAISAPTTFIALADAQGVAVREVNLAGNLAILRSRTAKEALNVLRLRLLRERVGAAT